VLRTCVDIIAPMGLELKPDENVLFPMPFEPNPPPPLVITNQRVVQTKLDGAVTEIEARSLKHVQRRNNGYVLVTMTFFLILGLPFVGCGASRYFEARGAKKPMLKEGEPRTKGFDKQVKAYKAASSKKVTGIIFLVGGAVSFYLAWICYKARLLVVCGGNRKVIEHNVKTKMIQDQIMMTLQAVQSSAKMMAPPPAAPPPKKKPA
jgi:hypothetical protein